MERSLFDLGTPEPEAAEGSLHSQIDDARKRHPDMIVLFHVGDFYPLFEEDATLASRLLGLPAAAPTGKQVRASFPASELEPYLRKLLQAGHRIAICDSVVDTR